jgi:Big-like domain-containing protein
MFFSKTKWFLVLALFSFLLVSVNCGHDQQLVSIAIEPSTETFGASNIPVAANAGSTVQLRALGNFIHPPVTKDITNQVVWASNTPDIATVDPTGLLMATGFACGGAIISATVHTNHSIGGLDSAGAIVTGNMNANVVCFASGPSLTVSFAGTGSGTVTSSPAGLNCSASCTATFSSGATVILTAAPSGSFGGWSGCDIVSGSGLVCTVNNLIGPRSLTVFFN